MPTTPLQHGIKPTHSKKAPDADEAERACYHATRTALDDLHVDLGRIAALADAAYHAIAEVPRPATAQGRRALRVVDAFAFSTWQASRTALQEADDVIDELEGRSGDVAE